jgi:hypothetical protein
MAQFSASKKTVRREVVNHTWSAGRALPGRAETEARMQYGHAMRVRFGKEKGPTGRVRIRCRGLG